MESSTPDEIDEETGGEETFAERYTERIEEREGFPFMRLPQELQQLVLDRNPRDLPRYSRVSSGFYTASDRLYWQRLCSQPILEREINRYLAEMPSLFGVFNLSSAMSHTETVIYFFTNATAAPGVADYHGHVIELYHGVEDDLARFDPTELQAVDPEILQRPLYAITLDPYHGSEVNTSKIRSQIAKYTATPVDGHRNDLLDLVSQYRILSRRLGCVTRAGSKTLAARGKRDYAKDRVLAQLDAQYREPHQQDVQALLLTWTYLYLQYRVLNLYPPVIPPPIQSDAFLSDGTPVLVYTWDPYEENTTREEALALISADIARMRQEVEAMYVRIRSALEKL